MNPRARAEGLNTDQSITGPAMVLLSQSNLDEMHAAFGGKQSNWPNLDGSRVQSCFTSALSALRDESPVQGSLLRNCPEKVFNVLQYGSAC